MVKPEITILGPGKVGVTLGVLARRAGYRITVAGRNVAKARAAARRIGRGVTAARLDDVIVPSGVVLLTVSDDAIESVAGALARRKAIGRRAILAHCSGALSSDILAPVRRACGSVIGSLHPLQTFPDVSSGVRRFPGTWCFCEGDGRAVKALMRLARDLGGRPVAMPSAGKLLYHASAVMASNYLCSLMDAALACAAHAGLSPQDALPALEPLVRATLENVFKLGPAKALTGPVARGDARLVEQQLAALSAADPALGKLYRLLGARAVGLAKKKKSITPKQAQGLTKIFGK